MRCTTCQNEISYSQGPFIVTLEGHETYLSEPMITTINQLTETMTLGLGTTETRIDYVLLTLHVSRSTHVRVTSHIPYHSKGSKAAHD